MAAQKGKDLLLKVRQDSDSEFTTVAGLRSRRISFNAEQVDITDSESENRWRELLGGAGVRAASLSGSGIFKDIQSDEIVRAAFFGGNLLEWQIVLPSFGILSGRFQISALEYGAGHNDEVVFDLSLESAGMIGFEAIA